MTLWHVIAPADGGGHNSLDYREDLTEALDALRHWRHSVDEDIAIAKGANGEPLRYVVWFLSPDTGNRVATGAYATERGARIAAARLGRRLVHPRQWGWMLAREWRAV